MHSAVRHIVRVGPAWLASAQTQRRWGIFAVYTAVATAFCLPLFERPLGLGRADWDVHLFYHASVLKSIVEYASPPFWNPWYCSGSVLWQNPQAPLLSPAYLLAISMPFALAMKINILVHYVIGLLGTHLLVTRALGVRFFPAAAYLSTVFSCSGTLALHLAVGHGWVLGAFYLPLHVFFVIQSVQNHRSLHAIAAGAVLALMVMNGAVHIVPMAALLDALLLSVLAVKRCSFQPLLSGLVVCGSAAFCAAPRLLPIALFLTDSRFVDHRFIHPDWMSADMVRRAYLLPVSLNVALPPPHFGWWEYGNYPGDLAVALLGASLIWIVLTTRSERSCLSVPLVLTSLVLLVVSAGEFHSNAPATWLHHVPWLSSFRIPSRYTIPFLLAAIATIATAFRGFSHGLVGWRWKIVATLVFVAGVCQVVGYNRVVLDDTFMEAPLDRGFRPLGGPSTLRTDGESKAYEHGSAMLRALFDDTNFYNCYEELAVQRTGDPAKPLVFTGAGAEVRSVEFAPNRVDAEVVGGSVSTQLFMNQNFADGWSSNLGQVTADPVAGHPSVVIPAGYRGTVTFLYSPPGLILGWATFLSGLAFVIWAVGGSVPRIGSPIA